VINDAPYGNERPYNALRLALNLVKRAGTRIRVFLLGDGVNCAIAGQKTPECIGRFGYLRVHGCRLSQTVACGFPSFGLPTLPALIT
jgi:uncharacterized protein involved in oxidation of intracellular sulfur